MSEIRYDRRGRIRAILYRGQWDSIRGQLERLRRERPGWALPCDWTVTSRIRQGMSVAEALETPPRRGGAGPGHPWRRYSEPGFFSTRRYRRGAA